MFFCNDIMIKKINIKNVINATTYLVDLKDLIFCVIKKFEKTFKKPTSPISNPIFCGFNLMISLSQTGK